MVTATTVNNVQTRRNQVELIEPWSDGDVGVKSSINKCSTGNNHWHTGNPLHQPITLHNFRFFFIYPVILLYFLFRKWLLNAPRVKHQEIIRLSVQTINLFQATVFIAIPQIKMRKKNFITNLSPLMSEQSFHTRKIHVKLYLIWLYMLYVIIGKSSKWNTTKKINKRHW